MSTELTRNEQIALALTAGIVATFRHPPAPMNAATHTPPVDRVVEAVDMYRKVLARVNKEFQPEKA